MKTEIITGINKLGRAGYVISNICRTVLLAAAIVCLVCAILMCFVPKDAVYIELYSSNCAVVHVDKKAVEIGAVEIDTRRQQLHTIGSPVSGTLEIGQQRYTIVADAADSPAASQSVFYLSDLKWLLFGGTVACAAAYITFFFACRLCACFKSCDTPFSEEIAAGIVRLAWSLIPVYVAMTLMEAAANLVFMGSFDIVIGIDLATVLLILFVFMLSYIFKHGIALQTEADETL